MADADVHALDDHAVRAQAGAATNAGRERRERVIAANDAAGREILAEIDRGLRQRLTGALHELLLATEGPVRER